MTRYSALYHVMSTCLSPDQSLEIFLVFMHFRVKLPELTLFGCLFFFVLFVYFLMSSYQYRNCSNTTLYPFVYKKLCFVHQVYPFLSCICMQMRINTRY